MKVSDILLLDCREKENRKLLRKKLKGLPMFIDSDKEWNEINTDDVEKVVNKVQTKYPITIGYIMISYDDELYYNLMIKEKATHKWVTTVYAKTLFEGYAKSLFVMYNYIKKMKKEKKE